MTSQEIDLETWAQAEKARIDRFVAWWKIQSAGSDPQTWWPLRMPPGEWDEQYRLWEEPNE